MDEYNRKIEGLSITQAEYQVLIYSAYRNLPTSTKVTPEEIDSILTITLSEYKRMLDEE